MRTKIMIVGLVLAVAISACNDSERKIAEIKFNWNSRCFNIARAEIYQAWHQEK